MVDIGTFQLIVVVSAIMGGLARTMLPYLGKRAEAERAGEDFKFAHNYIYTFLFSLATSTVAVLVGIAGILGQVKPDTPIFLAIGTAFGMTYVVNDFVNDKIEVHEAKQRKVTAQKKKDVIAGSDTTTTVASTANH